jgi:hypothetical protein
MAVPAPTIAAALQMFAVEQAKGREEDFSAIMRTMEELARVNAPTAASTNGSSAESRPAMRSIRH